MSFFNSNITGAGGSGGAAGGLVTKFEKSVTLTGEETAEVTINLADDISNYENITNEQIIAELTGGSATVSGSYELTHSYDNTTGILTITSTNSSVPFGGEAGSTVEFNIYIVGAVQIPPTPEPYYISIGQLGNGTHNIITTVGSDLFQKLTTTNFILRAKSCSGSFSCDSGIDKSSSTSTSPTISYNPNTGELTIDGLSKTVTGSNQWNQVSCSMSVEVLCFPTMVF